MEEAELRKIFNGKRSLKVLNKKGESSYRAGFSPEITFDKFKLWFDQQEFDQGCYYCGTTSEQSQKLYLLRPRATRGGKRGRRLELDRKDPDQPYDNLSNLVWCCYWCNNAKSNFFSETEFKPIADSIGHVIQEIILKE